MTRSKCSTGAREWNRTRTAAARTQPLYICGAYSSNWATGAPRLKLPLTQKCIQWPHFFKRITVFSSNSITTKFAIPFFLWQFLVRISKDTVAYSNAQLNVRFVTNSWQKGLFSVLTNITKFCFVLFWFYLTASCRSCSSKTHISFCLQDRKLGTWGGSQIVLQLRVGRDDVRLYSTMLNDTCTTQCDLIRAYRALHSNTNRDSSVVLPWTLQSGFICWRSTDRLL